MEPTITVADLLKLKVKICFRPLGNVNAHGYISADNTMELDPRSRIPIAKVVLHELIHALKPLWSEAKVAREESRLWKLAAWREKAALYRMLGKAVIWSGEGSIPDQPTEPEKKDDGERVE